MILVKKPLIKIKNLQIAVCFIEIFLIFELEIPTFFPFE